MSVSETAGVATAVATASLEARIAAADWPQLARDLDAQATRRSNACSRRRNAARWRGCTRTTRPSAAAW
ncbi:hypothetical protein X551_04664 [Methylibium sp. T29]|nr:hypothetical protein X551_04664 [Methylibium sp. T29]